jgi:hypothetical protein
MHHLPTDAMDEAALDHGGTVAAVSGAPTVQAVNN